MNTTKKRIGSQIKSKEVRLIDGEEQVGVVPVEEALEIANSKGLDLVEFVPGSKPPVCKILDYSKYLYEQDKARKKSRKHQKKIDLREIKFTPKIAEHDYQVKLKKIRKLIESDKYVKATVGFKGRETGHKEIGQNILNRLLEDTRDICSASEISSNNPRSMTMRLSPRAR